ncbi:MAG: outer membrane lipoprotein-sorting protein [Boseongicola sp.]|nr:outer membrane lipoprotein-sorting protein [Boseongicola sp.]
MMLVSRIRSSQVLPVILLALTAHLLEPSTGHAAESAEQAGLRIASEARESQRGFGNFTASLEMVLRNKRGQESRRELRIKVLEVPGEGDRTLIVFDRPRDVRGTGFLIHSFKRKADGQWLYLPSLKRVKRISSSSQSGSFMGSEFSYEDMGTTEVEKFTHRYLRTERCGSSDCTVSERVPVNKDSGYSRQLVWLDGEHRTVKVEFYDRRNAHLKTMVAEDYKQYLGRFWRAGRLTMTNHLTRKSTELLWSDYEFGTDLDAGDFTSAALRRVR